MADFKALFLFLAVMAVNLDFVFSVFLGVNYPFVSTNWLVLPVVLLYVVFSGHANVVGFLLHNPAIVGYFMITLASQAFYQVLHGGAGAGVVQAAVLLQTLNSLIVFFIFHELVASQKDVSRYVKFVAIATVLSTGLLFAIFSGMIGPEVRASWVGTRRIERVGIGDPNITFAYLCMGCCYWVLLVSRPLSANKLNAVIAAACLIGAALPAILGLSRAASLAFAACNLLSLILLVRYFRTTRVLKVLLLGLFLGSVALTQINWQRLELLWQRWSGSYAAGSVEQSASTRVRSAMWLLDQMMSLPNLYGKGYVEFHSDTGMMGYSHISLVDAYIYGGVVALLLLCSFLARNTMGLLASMRAEADAEMRATQLVLLLYVLAILLILCTLSVLWLKLVWAAFAVVAKCNLLSRQRREQLTVEQAGVGDDLYAVVR